MAARAFGRLFLVLSIGVAAGSCGQGRLAFRGRPPVILISVDTLRADMLPVYGRRDVETPAIDALRRDGILFTNAFSHVPLTLPSHLTMFTGLLPFEHGVLATNGSGPDGSASACRFPPSAVLVSPPPEVASAPGCQKSGAGQFVSWISSEPIAGTPRIRVAKTKIGRSVRIGASKKVLRVKRVCTRLEGFPTEFRCIRRGRHGEIGARISLALPGNRA